MLDYEKIVNIMILKLKMATSQIESTTSEFIYSIMGDNAAELRLDDFISIDRQLRRRAVESGIYLDSIAHDNDSFLVEWDMPWVMRKVQ